MIKPDTIGALRIGLTDDPEAMECTLGNPAGWHLFGPFHTEAAALRWKETLAALPGCAAAPPGKGWRFGFFYAAASTGDPKGRTGEAADGLERFVCSPMTRASRG